MICITPLQLPALHRAPVASEFRTPSHGSGGAVGGKGWDSGRDAGAGFKNRTGRLLQQGG